MTARPPITGSPAPGCAQRVHPITGAPYLSDADATDLISFYAEIAAELRLRAAIVTAAYEQMEAHEHPTPWAYQHACKATEDAVLAHRSFCEDAAANVPMEDTRPPTSPSRMPALAWPVGLRHVTSPPASAPAAPTRPDGSPAVLPSPVPPPFAGRCLVAGCPASAPAGRAYCDDHTNPAAELALPRCR